MHWYLECLTYGKDCLRELTFDDFKVVNTKLLPVLNDADNVNAVDIPDVHWIQRHYYEKILTIHSLMNVNHITNSESLIVSVYMLHTNSFLKEP